MKSLKDKSVLFAVSFAIATSSGLVGCGGGGGGDLISFGSPPCPPKDTTPPRLLHYTPPDGAMSLDPESVVVLDFNDAIRHSSVTSKRFTLRDSNNTQVRGAYQFVDDYEYYHGTLVIFVPTTPLDGNALYSVTVTTSITDTAGNHLENGAEWSFTSAPSGIGQWTPTSILNAPDPTNFHTSVWTGSEMLVWGGISKTSAGSSYSSMGYRYDPDTDTWTAMSNLSAPSPRSGHTAIWTGMEMIIWGGKPPGADYVWLNDGARYNPTTDTWQALSVSDAPEARSGHSAVWTGAQMLVWGGRNGGYFPDYPQAGGIYDPDTDTWQAMTVDNAPSGRSGQTAVWTGTQLLVWGGTSNTSFSRGGGRYDPQTDIWTATSMLNAPSARSGHTAVWTGTDMIVWGGYDDAQYHDTGARYDPLMDTWTATTLTDAPLARWRHSAVWSGNEMIIWGGYTDNIDSLYPRSGGRYHPGTDTWRYTVILSSPLGRTDHTAIWAGTKMIMWGGSNGVPLNSGGVYIP